MILKPFMLRRVKRDVENELSDKVSYLYSFSVELFIQFNGLTKEKKSVNSSCFMAFRDSILIQFQSICFGFVTFVSQIKMFLFFISN